MKHFVFALMAIVFAVSAEAADVGVSITVGQPGFYGHIDIGGFPKPQLIYPKPVVIVPGPAGVASPPPVYVHIPPGHEKKWKKHCHKYNACDRPVYFVRDKWYNKVYVPEYQARHGRGDKHVDRDKGQDSRSGPGKGPGKGPGQR